MFLDLATASGATWRGQDGKIATRFIDVTAVSGLGASSTKRARFKGRLLTACLHSLRAVAREIGATRIAIERDTGRGSGTEILRGNNAGARIVAEETRAEYTDSNAKQIRAALGDGGMSKERASSFAVRMRLIPNAPTEDEQDAAIGLMAVEQRDQAERIDHRQSCAGDHLRRRPRRAPRTRGRPRAWTGMARAIDPMGSPSWPHRRPMGLHGIDGAKSMT